MAVRSLSGWSFGKVWKGADVRIAVEMPVSQSMSVPYTSKDRREKWVSGVLDGSRVMAVARRCCFIEQRILEGV